MNLSTTKFSVGDVVKYIGPYLINGNEKNPKEDLVPGYIGTVEVLPDGCGRLLRVKFNEHRDDLLWPMFDSELELNTPTWDEVQEAVRVRVNELNILIDKHLGTEHAYPLMAGQFELLRLVVSLQDKHR
jgi:hypothetical protein